MRSRRSGTGKVWADFSRSSQVPSVEELSIAQTSKGRSKDWLARASRRRWTKWIPWRVGRRMETERIGRMKARRSSEARGVRSRPVSLPERLPDHAHPARRVEGAPRRRGAERGRGVAVVDLVD